MLFKHLVLIAVGTVALARAETAEQAVMIAERVWSKALVAGDVATLERVMASDVTYGHASGKTDTKRTYIERIQSGAQQYKSFQYDPGATVRIYGDTALVNAVAQVASVTDGKPNALHMRFLHVYVKKDGQWMLVAHQSAKLPD